MVDDVAGGAVADLDGQLVDATLAVAVHATHGADGAGAHRGDLAWNGINSFVLFSYLRIFILGIIDTVHVLVQGSK